MEARLKILVVRFSSIGDIVLTTPVVRMLKKLQHVEVHYLTKSPYKSLLVHNPYIDKIHLINKSISEVVESLKNEHFDLIIDLHNNVRTKALRLKLGIPSKSFNKLNMEKFLYVNFKLDILPEVHIVDRYLKTVSDLIGDNDNLGLDYFLSEDDSIDNKEFIKMKAKGYVAFAIGGQHATKIMPTSKIIAIINSLNETVVLVGGPEDAERGELIIAAAKNAVNYCGKFSINQSAYLVQQAKYIITHDTGMMHIAAAFKKKIYSVWGNTVPKFGMTPYLAVEGSKIIEVEHLDCRPCSKIGFNKCPKGHFKCMEQIDESMFLSE